MAFGEDLWLVGGLDVPVLGALLVPDERGLLLATFQGHRDRQLGRGQTGFFGLGIVGELIGLPRGKLGNHAAGHALVEGFDLDRGFHDLPFRSRSGIAWRRLGEHDLGAALGGDLQSLGVLLLEAGDGLVSPGGGVLVELVLEEARGRPHLVLAFDSDHGHLIRGLAHAEVGKSGLAFLGDDAKAVVAKLELALAAFLVRDDVGKINLGQCLEGQLGSVLVGGIGHGLHDLVRVAVLLENGRGFALGDFEGVEAFGTELGNGPGTAFGGAVPLLRGAQQEHGGQDEAGEDKAGNQGLAIHRLPRVIRVVDSCGWTCAGASGQRHTDRRPQAGPGC